MVSELAAVRRHARQLSRASTGRDVAIYAAYQAGVPVTRIAKEAGISVQRTYQVIDDERRNA